MRGERVRGTDASAIPDHRRNVTVTEYLERRWDTVLELTIQHALVVIGATLLAALVGITLGALAHAHRRRSSALLTVTSALFTVPALAYFTILVVPLGLGTVPALVVLTIYALMPITRNTVTGLRGVDPAIVKAATGMGMGRTAVLLRIQLPLAWPVIVSGMRVATVMSVGIAAIAAYVSGPGLGAEIFGGLGALGSARAEAQAIVGTAGVVLVALVLDVVIAQVGRLLTPGGLR
jgi:osmoprotectant transport system permease protein